VNDPGGPFLFLGFLFIFLGTLFVFRANKSGKNPLEYEAKDSVEVEYAKKLITPVRRFKSSFAWVPRVLFSLGVISLAVALGYHLAS
jgi:hypothetical protein